VIHTEHTEFSSTASSYSTKVTIKASGIGKRINKYSENMRIKGLQG
jgi:hypothetical protein